MRAARESLQVLGDTAHFSTVYTGCCHDANALRHILDSLRPRCAGRLICLLGGLDGESPQDRHALGEAAGEYADLVILTEDPCCREHPDTAGKALAGGVSAHGGRCKLIADRPDAIHYLLDHCGRDDIAVLLRRCPEWGRGGLPLTDAQIAAQYLKTK